MVKANKQPAFYNNVIGAEIDNAARIALAHDHAYYDINKACPPQVGEQSGITRTETPDYSSTAAREIPISLFNRTMSLGQTAPATSTQIDAIVKWMDEHASANWAFTLGSHLQPADIDQRLAERGFVLQPGGMAHYWRDATPSDHVIAPGIEIVEATSVEDSEIFSRLFDESFQINSLMKPWFAALVGRSNWHCFIARYEGEPAGVGALMNTGGVAWLGIGGTLPAFRAKGVQQALLAARINKAHSLNLEGITIESGYNENDAQPFPISGRNIQRLGFTLSHVSRNYSRNKT